MSTFMRGNDPAGSHVGAIWLGDAPDDKRV